jgi:hypothetical protein
MFVFGLYLTVLGLALVLAPNMLLPLFGFPKTNEVWIRVVGMLLFFLSFYYIMSARSELKDFFQWTVYARSMVIVFLALFVSMNWVKPILLLFGVIDLAAAIWTEVALRADRRATGTQSAAS